MKKLKQALQWRGVPLQTIVDKHKTPHFNFISETTTEDESLGFSKDDSILMHSKFNWANVVATIGLFTSASVAKKNGWDISIADGYSEAFFSKSDGSPLFVFILK